jgi:hypothetical protein
VLDKGSAKRFVTQAKCMLLYDKLVSPYDFPAEKKERILNALENIRIKRGIKYVQHYFTYDSVTLKKKLEKII